VAQAREHPAVNSVQRTRLAGALLALACAAAGAQQAGAPGSAREPAAGPALGTVFEDRLLPVPGGKPGHRTRETRTLPQGAYRFQRGEYSSQVSGLTLKLPQLRDEQIVSVREAVMQAQGKDIEASHILFVPGAQGEVIPLGPVSAVVVTRLRKDRPHDRESVLKAWEPRSPEQRKAMEARGVEFHRIQTGLGEGLERIVPNRLADGTFPYRTQTDETAGQQLKSVGVTRYLVSGDHALLEFSQVFPCRELAAPACKEAALKASDRFVQGVSSFVLLRSSGAAPAASAPQRAK
jgi:hypothetical protein